MEEEKESTPISAGGAEIGHDGAVLTPDEAAKKRQDSLDSESWREQK